MIDSSKDEIIQKFRAIKLKAREHKELDCSKLGIIIVCIGFMIPEDKYGSLLLQPLGAHLEFPKILGYDYHLTVDGNTVCFSALCTDLASEPNIVCALINRFDEKMH